MEVPKRLARRPVFKGFPVPANVLVDPTTGIPDFATVDEHEAYRLMRERRCALCGEAMYRWFGIVGGPNCEELHLFRDGPMHIDCAKFALVTCPFLSKPEHGYRSMEGLKQHEGYSTGEVTIVTDVKPEVQGLFVAREYHVGLYGGHMVVKVGPYREVTWWRGGEKVDHQSNQ